MNKKVIIAIVIVIIAVAAFVFWSTKKDKTEVKYRTEKVETGEITSSVMATGTVNAVTTVQVGTQISGMIKEIFVDYNSIVKKGQMLALIDPALTEAQVEQARANLLSAKANVEKSKSALQYAKVTYERNRELYQKGFISKNDRDLSETNYTSAIAQVKANEASVKQMEASLKQSQTNFGYTKIISPINGMVISRAVDVGQTVAASFSTPTLFSIAEDLTKMRINTTIDEADIGKIKQGQKVEFTVDAYTEDTFEGNVSEVRNSPTTVQNVVTYDVIVKVDNPELKLKPGMTANVSVITDVRKNVLKIPDAALRFKPDTGKVKKETKLVKGKAVWLLKNNQPVRIPIETGATDGSYTEVVTGGIKAGDEVIVESSDSKKNDDKRAMRFMPR